MTISVGIIGVGAAGLVAIKQFIQWPALFSVQAFELADKVGGTWIYNENTGFSENGIPIVSSMYKNLRTNLPKEIMQYSDSSFEEGLSSFIKHDQVLKYLQSYADIYGLEKHIKFKTQVVGIEPLEGSEEGQSNLQEPKDRWKVSYCCLEEPSTIMIANFSAIVVCSGHYSVPYVPHIPGTEQFRGILMHSHDYRNPEVFADMKVICLGASSSGQDISVELSSHCKEIVVSHRRDLLTTSLPRNVTQAKPITRFTQDGVVFEDGKEFSCDAVLLCTGYCYDFGFLSKSCRLNVTSHRVYPLYKHIFHCIFPSMSFIGIPKVILPFPQFELQAKLIVASFMRDVLPSTEQMIEDVDKDFRSRLSQGFPSHYAHTMSHLQWEYNDLIGRMACTSSLPRRVITMYNFVGDQRRKDLIHYKDRNVRFVSSDGNAECVFADD